MPVPFCPPHPYLHGRRTNTLPAVAAPPVHCSIKHQHSCCYIVQMRRLSMAQYATHLQHSYPGVPHVGDGVAWEPPRFRCGHVMTKATAIGQAGAGGKNMFSLKSRCMTIMSIVWACEAMVVPKFRRDLRPLRTPDSLRQAPPKDDDGTQPPVKPCRFCGPSRCAVPQEEDTGGIHTPGTHPLQTAQEYLQCNASVAAAVSLAFVSYCFPAGKRSRPCRPSKSCVLCNPSRTRKGGQTAHIDTSIGVLCISAADKTIQQERWRLPKRPERTARKA